MLENLIKYLEETPKEQIQKDWDAAMKESVGVESPSIGEFLKSMEAFTNQAIIMMGLPLAGKSTWINKQKEKNPPLWETVQIISADEYKENHPDYNPDNVTAELHEESVEWAENKAYELAENGTIFVMDGGGINNRYTKRIIKNLKEKGYTITLVYVKTPYKVCLDRNKQRTRKVPEVAITDKALKEISQFHKLSELVDHVIVDDYFTNDHIFVDMDGVIAAQSTLPIVNGEIDFVNGEVHKWQKPVKPVIDLLNDIQETYPHKTVYVLSATPNSFSSDEKQAWLDKYFPIPKERRFFVNQGRHKAEMLDNLRRKFKLHPKDVLMVDDMHDILYKVKDRGMNAMHPSEFLTHNW